MNKIINHVQLVGNIGKDLEEVSFDSGNRIIKTSLATTEKFQKKDGSNGEKTEWHNLIFPNRMSDMAIKNIKKGDKLCVQGKIRYNHWEDKDGNKKTITNIEVDEVMFL